MTDSKKMLFLLFIYGLGIRIVFSKTSRGNKHTIQGTNSFELININILTEKKHRKYNRKFKNRVKLGTY